MTAVFSPLRRTFKSQYPSGNSRRHAGFGPASYTQEDMPMGTTANTGQSTWEQIHGGVRETERLIGQKNYNLAMVKARQTLEYMVKCLCERYGILETGLLEMIDALYSAGKYNCESDEPLYKENEKEPCMSGRRITACMVPFLADYCETCRIKSLET